MIFVRNLRLDPGEDTSVLRARAAKASASRRMPSLPFVLVKRSLDARHKDDIHYVCSAAVTVAGDKGRIIARAKCADAAVYTPPEYDIPHAENMKKAPGRGRLRSGGYVRRARARACRGASHSH